MTKAGIIVEYEGLQGFIPGSHLSPEYTTERLESEEGLGGEKIAIKFLEVDEEIDDRHYFYTQGARVRSSDA